MADKSCEACVHYPGNNAYSDRIFASQKCAKGYDVYGAIITEPRPHPIHDPEGADLAEGTVVCDEYEAK